MIQVNKIIPQTVELFSPDNISMGFINEYELYDIRVQIYEQKAEGYYVMYNNNRIDINSSGRIMFNGDGFFDIIDNAINKLIGLI